MDGTWPRIVWGRTLRTQRNCKELELAASAPCRSLGGKKRSIAAVRAAVVPFRSTEAYDGPPPVPGAVAHQRAGPGRESLPPLRVRAQDWADPHRCSPCPSTEARVGRAVRTPTPSGPNHSHKTSPVPGHVQVDCPGDVDCHQSTCRWEGYSNFTPNFPPKPVPIPAHQASGLAEAGRLDLPQL